MEPDGSYMLNVFGGLCARTPTFPRRDMRTLSLLMVVTSIFTLWRPSARIAGIPPIPFWIIVLLLPTEPFLFPKLQVGLDFTTITSSMNDTTNDIAFVRKKWRVDLPSKWIPCVVCDFSIHPWCEIQNDRNLNKVWVAFLPSWLCKSDHNSRQHSYYWRWWVVDGNLMDDPSSYTNSVLIGILEGWSLTILPFASLRWMFTSMEVLSTPCVWRH